MTPNAEVELFANSQWNTVGVVELLGLEDSGWQARSRIGYDMNWAMTHMDKRDAHAFGCHYPVGLETHTQAHWPVFLIDMLPQGYGRGELLRRLGLPETAAESADWQLLMRGAANPIGNLRIKGAAEWLAMQPGKQRGFTDDEVAQRGDEFTEFLARHGLFVAGSSGVQGEWPKLLLTRAKNGLLYLDHALPDDEAQAHFIVKFGRGANERLAQILRHEAPYMAIAKHLGLDVYADLELKERALFIPRFDRLVGNGGVTRLAQESIASLTGKAGFGVVPSHNEVCEQIVRRCTAPERDIMEYLRRDVANLALGNKDNHARNTAIQRDFAGNIRLSPLYDFAPMYLHPDGISRRIRWENNDDSRPEWSLVLDTVCAIGETQGVALNRSRLKEGLQTLAPKLHQVALHGEEMGMERDVHAFLRPGIERLAHELAAVN